MKSTASNPIRNDLNAVVLKEEELFKVINDINLVESQACVRM